MTEREAIKFFKERIEVASDYPEIKEYSEALKVGIQALEKQISKKPTTNTYNNTTYCTCPSCGLTTVLYNLCEMNYCKNCGQRLTWTEESEEQ